MSSLHSNDREGQKVSRSAAYNRPVVERPPIPFDAIPILATLKAEDRAALSPLCELQAYEKGAKIFEEGEPAE